MTQTRVPWQVKYVALVLIWGSSFLLMKVGLESLSAVQISGLRILSGAAVLSVLLLARGGHLPTGAPGVGPPVRLRVLPRCAAVHALRVVRDQDQLGAGRHRQRRHADRHGAGDHGDPAGGAGHRAAARGGGRRLPRRRHDHAAVDLRRPARPRRVLDGAGGRRELRHRVDLQPALPQRGRPRRAVAAGRHAAHRAGADGAGRARLGAAAAGGPGGDLVLRRPGCRHLVLAAAGLRARARAWSAPGSPTRCSSTWCAAPARSSARRSPT